MVEVVSFRCRFRLRFRFRFRSWFDKVAWVVRVVGREVGGHVFRVYVGRNVGRWVRG